MLFIPKPPSHYCARCGKALWNNRWPYAVCKYCAETKSCAHGTPLKEPCGKCDLAGDLAYDAAKGN